MEALTAIYFTLSAIYLTGGNMKSLGYRFSFGPWNISEGADPFGPEVREAYPHDAKYALYKKLGFDGVQFHDDDVVPGLDELSQPDRLEGCRGRSNIEERGARARVRRAATMVRIADNRRWLHVQL